MKTTIELPDDLIAKAKAVAAERRTTLKSMIEHALRRELAEGIAADDDSSKTTTNEYGFPVFEVADPTKVVTSEDIYQLLEDEG